MPKKLPDHCLYGVYQTCPSPAEVSKSKALITLVCGVAKVAPGPTLYLPRRPEPGACPQPWQGLLPALNPVRPLSQGASMAQGHSALGSMERPSDKVRPHAKDDHFASFVSQEFRKNTALKDPTDVHHKIDLAKDCSFLVRSVHAHKVWLNVSCLMVLCICFSG